MKWTYKIVMQLGRLRLLFKDSRKVFWIRKLMKDIH